MPLIGTPAIISEELVQWSSATWTDDGGGKYHIDKTVTAVDLTRTIVTLLNHDQSDIIAIYPRFTDSTTIRLHGDNPSAPTNVTAEAMITTYAGGVTIQHVSDSVTQNGGGSDETINTTVTAISSTSRYRVISGGLGNYTVYNKSSGNGVYWGPPRSQMTTTTNLRTIMYSSGTGTGDDTFYLQLMSWI